MVNYILDRRHVLRTQSLHKHVYYRWILNLAYSIGSLWHQYLFVDIFDLKNLLLIDLISFFLKFIVLIVLNIRLEDKLFSSIACRDLFELIAFNLLGSPEQLYIGTLLFILLVGLKMRLLWDVIDLDVSLHPTITVDLTPSDTIFRLLCQKFL